MAVTRRLIVRMNGRNVRYAESVQYLGVSVDERMNFREHLKYLRCKLSNVVGQMRRVLRYKWRMRKCAWKIVYKGLFVACVMYGASVWCDSIKYGYARMLMNRCQRVAMYACVNVRRTVSTESMQVLMGAPP